MDERQALMERSAALREEIYAVTEDINYYVDVLNAKYVDVRHMYNARNAAWAELEALTTHIDAMDDATDWDSMAEAGREADNCADVAGL